MISPRQTANQPPTPAYIFRAHQNAIHALHFFQSNEFLASGDSSGLVIIWRLTTRRPARSWQAHDGGIMGIQTWGKEEKRLITHGRDHKLRVWDLRADDFDDQKMLGRWNAESSERNEHNQETKPWLLHALDVNALNFCAFAICEESDSSTRDREGEEDTSSSSVGPVLLAAPNGLDSGGVDIFQLPSERRVSKLQSDKDINMGMVMCLRLFKSASNGKLMLVGGFEDGQVTVHCRRDVASAPVWLWDRIMISRPHTQPILSLDVIPDQSGFITSSADATIAKFSTPETTVPESKPDKVNETKHAGQQDLKIRSDGRVFATAGWDKRVRVYSAKTLKELAVLKWHQEGCYAVAFAKIDPSIPAPTRASSDSLIKLDAVARIRLERDEKVKQVHWLAAGSKDGKISLWDVY